MIFHKRVRGVISEFCNVVPTQGRGGGGALLSVKTVLLDHSKKSSVFMGNGFHISVHKS